MRNPEGIDFTYLISLFNQCNGRCTWSDKYGYTLRISGLFQSEIDKLRFLYGGQAFPQSWVLRNQKYIKYLLEHDKIK